MYRESIDKDELAELPLIQFEGDITLVESKEDYLASIEYLSQQTLLGFDTETNLHLKRGLFTKLHCCNWQPSIVAFLFPWLNKIGLPNGLKNILENRIFKKLVLPFATILKAFKN